MRLLCSSSSRRLICGRVLVSLILAGLIVGGCSSNKSASPKASDKKELGQPWVMFRQNAGHTGRTTALGPSKPVKKWAINMPSTTPAIGPDGSVYVGARFITLEKHGSSLFALNPDGKQKWSYELDDSRKSIISPTVGKDGMVYFGVTINYDMGRNPQELLDKTKGVIVAVDSDGKKKWEFELDKAHVSEITLGEDGTIYVGSGKLYALNPTGTVRWEFKDTDLSMRYTAAAIGNDGTIYVAATQQSASPNQRMTSYVYALNPDGSVKWRAELKEGSLTSPVVDGQTLYVIHTTDWEGARKRLFALSTEGKKKWEFEIQGSQVVAIPPAIATDGTVYVGCASGIGSDAKLYALSPQGRKKWEKKIDDALSGSVLIDKNNTVYVVDGRGVIHALLPPDGREKWVFPAKSMGYGGMSSVLWGVGAAISPDGTIYFPSVDSDYMATLMAIGE